MGGWLHTKRLYLSALKYCHLSGQFYNFRLDHVGIMTLCPPKMKEHAEDKDLRNVGCHLKGERQGQPLLTQGADSQYWKSVEWVIFQTSLETAGPEFPEAWAHERRVCKDPTAETAQCYRGCLENLLILTLP